MGSMPIEFAKTALAPAALPHTMSRSCAINVGGAVASRALLGLQTAICDRSVNEEVKIGVYHRILQVWGDPAAASSGAWCVGR